MGCGVRLADKEDKLAAGDSAADIWRNSKNLSSRTGGIDKVWCLSSVLMAVYQNAGKRRACVAKNPVIYAGCRGSVSAGVLCC